MARPRLFDFNSERASIIDMATDRVVADKATLAETSMSHGIEYVLNEAAFHEIERLKKYGSDPNIGEVGGLGFWQSLAHRVGSAGDVEKTQVLHRLAHTYLTDLAGNFDPRVFQVANKVVPAALSLLFNAQQGSGGVRRRFRRIRDRVQIEGDIEKLRRLARIGTLIMAPTHLSNLDSIVIGWALNEAGLPPVTYGAGKNLFTNPLLSYFMQNLGAYKVDRRIQHEVYKSCLKAYSEVLLERGFHSLFFPGGTRSRAGTVETDLKLGLLGTALTAFIRSQMVDKPRKIFVVPVTLNYGLVLEAQGLIDEHFRRVGKGQYLIPDDPFDSPLEVARFAMKVATLNTSMVIRFGEAIDVLGHDVDAEGTSHDRSGRAVDLRPFVEVKPGEVGLDSARDREYTRQTGLALADGFVKNTVIMPTHFLGSVLFNAARRNFPNLDEVAVLRFAHDLQIPWDTVNSEARKLQRALVDLQKAGGIRLHRPVAESSVPELIDEGLKAFAMYHSPTAAEATGQGVRLQNLNLLSYYGNRLKCLDLDPLR